MSGEALDQVSTLKAALAADPGNAEAHYELANALRKLDGARKRSRNTATRDEGWREVAAVELHAGDEVHLGLAAAAHPGP